VTITVDTNILVRAVVGDDQQQALAAGDLLTDAWHNYAAKRRSRTRT